MRRMLIALASSALGLAAFAGAALASPGTSPDVELTVTPAEPKTGDAVMVQAYVHFGTKPYQGATVEFVISGPGLKEAMTLHGKPGQAGFYRNQFTAQGTGDYQIATKVDGTQVSPKPYHLQVTAASGAAATDWTPFAAAAGALALLGLGGALLLRRGRLSSRRTIAATN